MPCKPAESVSGRPHTPCCSHLPACAFAPVLTPAPVRRFIMSLQKSALNGLTADHHVAFCFTFLYAFPFLFDDIVSWAPPWYLSQLSQSLAILLLQIISVFNSEVVLREFVLHAIGVWIQGSGVPVVCLPHPALLPARASEHGQCVTAGLASPLRAGRGLSPQLSARPQWYVQHRQRFRSGKRRQC